MCLRVLKPSTSKSSTCFEVKNFASNNNWSIIGKSDTYWDLCMQEKVFTRASSIGDWSKDSIVVWYFGIGQDSDKIPYTSNLLFLISGFLEVVIWKSPGGIFVLREIFLIRQQITVFIQFSLRLVCSMICWCLHDLHIM